MSKEDFESQYLQKPLYLKEGDIVKLHGYGDREWTVESFGTFSKSIVHVFSYISHKNEIKRKMVNIEDIKSIL